MNPLLNHFPGSRIVMDLTPLSSSQLSKIELAKLKGVVRRSITLCTDCGLSCGMQENGWSPLPYAPVLSAQTSGNYAVLGDAPDQTDAMRGKPFISRSSKLLAGMIKKAGLDWDAGVKLNVVSCFPHTGVGKEIKARSANDEEITSCRKHLIAQLSTTPYPYLLLMGAGATKAWRPDLKITNVRGSVYSWTLPNVGSFLVFPISHPLGVFRQPAMREGMQANLRVFAEMVNGECDPVDLISELCAVCMDTALHRDPDMVGYCVRHWGRHGGNWKLARVKDEVSVKPKPVTVGKGRHKRFIIEGQETLL